MKRYKKMIEQLKKCTICPHDCKIDRIEGQVGRCKAKDTVKIALYQYFCSKNFHAMLQLVYWQLFQWFEDQSLTS